MLQIMETNSSDHSFDFCCYLNHFAEEFEPTTRMPRYFFCHKNVFESSSLVAEIADEQTSATNDVSRDTWPKYVSLAATYLLPKESKSKQGQTRICQRTSRILTAAPDKRK